jgi:hypothetical protein
VTTLALSCGPDVRKFFAFNKCSGPQSVWSSNFSVYFSTAVDVFTDLCIMAMPLRLIYNIKVSLKQKIGLVAVFSLGFVMIVFAIIRANQSLAQQGFVNLTLLLIWSTLAASICTSLWVTVWSSSAANRPLSRPRRHPPRPQSPHHHPRPRLRGPLRRRRLPRDAKKKLDLRHPQERKTRQERRPRLAQERQQQHEIGDRFEFGCGRVAGGDSSSTGCGEFSCSPCRDIGPS